MDGDSKGEFGMNACYVDAEYGQGTMQKGGNSGKILLVTKKARILLNLLQNIHHVVKQ